LQVAAFKQPMWTKWRKVEHALHGRVGRAKDQAA
jgi:hypothetical protein